MESLYSEYKGREYLEQWHRVKRWYKKMLLVKQGYYKEFDHFELLDVVYAYFMNVQHLKDWVKNYDSVLEGDINKLYQVECFKICADFINNHKHLVRNGSGKKAATDPDASIKHQSVTVEVGTIYLSLSAAGKVESEVMPLVDEKFLRGPKYRWDIVHSGNKYDAYDIGKQCFEEWSNFLERHNLLQSSSS